MQHSSIIMITTTGHFVLRYKELQPSNQIHDLVVLSLFMGIMLL